MKKLKIGVIGAGGISTCHLNAYKANPDCEVIAIAEINKERLEEKAEAYCIPNRFTDYNRMLEMDLDGVSVCTWNNVHAPASIAALKAGKNVLCEKPLALNAEEARQIDSIANKSGKLLMVGFVMRFEPVTAAAKEIIDSGKLGNIYYAKASYIRRCGNPGGWFSDKKRSGGGPLADLGVHVIDRAWYLMGKPGVKWVVGNTYANIGPRSGIKGYDFYKTADYDDFSDVEDFANAMIKFENDASMFVEVSYTQNIKEDRTGVELYGDKGGAVLEPYFEIYGEDTGYLVDIKPVLNSSTDSFGAEIGHFTDCILHRKECMSAGADGVKIMKILDAIYESSKIGKMVYL